MDIKSSLKAKARNILLFSSVGYTDQSVVVTNQSTYNITLEENVEALSEVVIVGYRVQKIGYYGCNG